MNEPLNNSRLGDVGSPMPPRGAQSISTAFRGLLRHLSPRRRRSMVPLLGLMLAGALAELLTIGALVPFLSILTDATGDSPSRFAASLLSVFGVAEDGGLVLLAALFGFAVVVAAVIRLWLLWATQSFVFGAAQELAIAAYSHTLYQPYAYHTARNSSEILAIVDKVQMATNGAMLPLLQSVMACVIAAFIVAGLVIVDPAVALSTGLVLASIYLVVTVATRRRLKRNGAVIARTQSERIKAMREGLGGIRDVLLDQAQPAFIEKYGVAESAFRRAIRTNQFISQAPRLIVEATGMVLIVIVALFVVTERPGGLAEAVPLLGALALGAARLMPLLQQIYNGWAQALGNKQSIEDVTSLLDAPAPLRDEPSASAPLLFERVILLENVSYAHPGGRARALSDISLRIPKGARIGIAGKTGSGKSTLMDLIMGLLEPTSGRIFIDSVLLSGNTRRAWQANIAHVPQFIYLADASVAENVAFGIGKSDIDMARVRAATERAQLTDVISNLPHGLDTRVGERGVQLSGGQRQRLGLARALYRRASVLILDEATSALDRETENTVMDSVNQLDRELTIIVVAHRETTLEQCDAIIRLDGGSIRVLA